MRQDRLRHWIDASHALSAVEPFLIPVVQGLGRLDCRLIREEERFLKLSAGERAQQLESARLTDRFTLSYLWVLGAYEMLRTVDQRCTDSPAPWGSELRDEVKGLKHHYNRLRVPLAKLEPAWKHPDDSPIAYPAISADRGIAWQLGTGTFVSRRELSDQLLSLITRLRSHDRQRA